MDKIIIEGLEIQAKHGVLPSEKVTAQAFVFDAVLGVDFSHAARDDDLSKTVNYAEVCAEIERITTQNSFNLIEKLAYECACAVLDKFESVIELTLTVKKPQAPIAQKFASVGVSISFVREEVYLSLGSSLGDKKQYLDTAIEKIGATHGVKVKKVSPYIQSEPYGGVAKNAFLNCAVCVETYLPPHTLLDELQRIEAECGRVRDVHWDDRTLDIDIIFFGDRKICDGRLTVPHPDYKNRDFVKIPLKNIAPYLIKD